ncbi:hypothetical protein A2886_02335 [candidate division WWE3 bacterium RIFCSPHIGHO2_01_FULL_42_13]|uniref:YcaO domain-containing protein n=1 Tax=candidate division WWE3 bacterium RIFCSPHIGHO2_01_FULL_42_13 TaxID=1802617 RepID=A0A1F4URS2_UNCKA|nr:MAG: hypothetical protein A2886_02335 [candidate division WWE3 bacterium RIFCSPHIGHO2_01_FULL_42_13]
MNKWITLSEGWELLPTLNGLELRKGERSIDIESESERDLAYLSRVLSGQQKVTSAVNQEISKTLAQLKGIGAVSFGKTKPSKSKGLSVKSRLRTLREAFVGKGSYIPVVHNTSQEMSSFNLGGNHLFSAKYLNVLGEEDFSAGFSSSKVRAEIKAIMEALERVASGIVPKEKLLNASAKELGGSALDPRSVVTYKNLQYDKGLPFKRYDPKARYFWKSVVKLASGKEFYLPVELLYYPILKAVTPRLYTYSNSSGVAGGFSFESSLIGGLFEAIERDAYMITWVNRISHPLIRRDCLSSDQNAKVERIKSVGYEVHLVNMTMDLTPVVLAVAVSESGQTCLLLGMSSRPTLSSAIGRALDELEQQLYWDFRKDHTVYTLKDPTKVQSTEDHAALYASSTHLRKAEFLWSGKPENPNKGGDEKFQRLDNLVELLKTRDVETYALDLTPPDMKEAGVHIIRAIPQGLVPISFGYGTEALGMRRLATVPKATGLSKKSWQNGVFTHPFA